jgi:hypothetical protein
VVFFTRYAADGIRTHDLSLARTPSTIPFWFPTYYTKSSVNYLFEALNEFKSKGCQLQSFITFLNLQLSF